MNFCQTNSIEIYRQQMNVLYRLFLANRIVDTNNRTKARTLARVGNFATAYDIVRSYYIGQGLCYEILDLLLHFRLSLPLNYTGQKLAKLSKMHNLRLLIEFKYFNAARKLITHLPGFNGLSKTDNFLLLYQYTHNPLDIIAARKAIADRVWNSPGSLLSDLWHVAEVSQDSRDQEVLDKFMAGRKGGFNSVGNWLLLYKISGQRRYLNQAKTMAYSDDLILEQKIEAWIKICDYVPSKANKRVLRLLREQELAHRQSQAANLSFNELLKLFDETKNIEYFNLVIARIESESRPYSKDREELVYKAMEEIAKWYLYQEPDFKNRFDES